MEDPLARKEAFYLELDRLQDNDDDCDDPTGLLFDTAASGANAQESPTKGKSSSSRQITRSVSDPHHGAPPAASDEPSALVKRHTVASIDLAPGEIKDANNRAASAAQQSTGKRKRSSPMPSAPHDQQIFKGLSLFFVPNNDVHPGRRLRIHKAIEFGATWQKTWAESITHVVVDKGIEYHTVLKFLGIEHLPPKIILVNEDYPADCIAYRSILNPQHLRYQVKAVPQPSGNPVERLVANESSATIPQLPQSSLHLKSRLSTRQATGRQLRSNQRATVSQTPSKSADDTPSSPLAGITNSAQDTDIAADNLEHTEFALAVGQARLLRGISLEDDDEDVDSTSCRSRKTSSDLTHTAAPAKVTNRLPKIYQDKFQCMQKHTGEAQVSANRTTIDILQQLADYYDCMGDEWRTRAYRKAISSLRIHPTKVRTKEQALELPQIGERIAARIEEIAFTARLRQLDVALLDPKDQVIRYFSKIYGVGFALASKWAEAGHKTLEDLLDKAELTVNQRVGIEHYDDFNTRIPRTEVAQLGEVVRSELKRLSGNAELIVGGSYRRGAETSGDIDCIITHPTRDVARLRTLVLDQLVPNLMRTGFLVAELSTSSRVDGSKWLGACCLPQLPLSAASSEPRRWRRIDLLIVPATELGAALIYFTGNDIFNRSIRLLASKKGMRLNQRGLYKNVVRSTDRKKLNEGELVEGRDEKAIFSALDVPWRPPEHRIC